MCIPEVDFEVAPRFVNLGLIVPVQNPSTKVASTVQDDVCHIHDLRLTIWTLGRIRVMYKFINSGEDSVDRVDGIIHHSTDLVFLILKFLGGHSSIALVEFLNQLVDIVVDSTSRWFPKGLKVMMFYGSDKLLAQSLFDCLDFAKDSESLPVLFSVNIC